MKKLIMMMCILAAGSMTAQTDTIKTPEQRKTDTDTRVIEERNILTDTAADKTIRRSSTTTQDPNGTTTKRKMESEKTKTKTTVPNDTRRKKQEPNTTTPNNTRTNTSGTGTTVPPRP